VEAPVIDKPRPKKRDKRLPPLDLLDDSDLRRPAQKDIDETASIIVKTLKEFGVPVNVVGAKVGPSVTQYQVEPGFVAKPGPDGMSKQWKVRVAQISSLGNDIALALSANTIRIEAPVPGQSYVGIEVPHRRTSLVSLRPVMASEAFQKINSPLAIALGRDVSGAAIAADLGSMPHMLIAGTTGSGKSVCITALVMCLACHNTPDDLRMVLIDPKMVELVRFNGLPHLFGKVETELDRIIGVLRWVVKEMDRRYKLFETLSARNLENYNQKTARKPNAERLPRIVVVIDELADLMMQAPDETERTVVRLAQMARATGIHLVVATQRPSTDIVTGLIKANFPARISFAVASGIDSRVILDTQGAESLLGRGDMLFLAPEVGSPIRVQGCFVSDKEMDRVVSYWREQMGDEVMEEIKIETAAASESVKLKPGQAPWDVMLAREAVLDDKDQQIEQAIAIIQKHGTASASLLQRKMRIGYPRAARLMDELKAMGIIGREQAGGKTREVFVEEDDDPIGDRAARHLDEDDEDE
jgi:S-DNA-T family DNA segregation ATPase FtsK/SpoIIIE